MPARGYYGGRSAAVPGFHSAPQVQVRTYLVHRYRRDITNDLMGAGMGKVSWLRSSLRTRHEARSTPSRVRLPLYFVRIVISHCSPLCSCHQSASRQHASARLDTEKARPHIRLFVLLDRFYSCHLQGTSGCGPVPRQRKSGAAGTSSPLLLLLSFLYIFLLLLCYAMLCDAGLGDGQRLGAGGCLRAVGAAVTRHSRHGQVHPNRRVC